MRKYIILLMLSCMSLAARGQDIISDSLLSEVFTPPIQAQSLKYWFDSNTNDIRTVDGLSGNYVLDVTSLNDGLHTVHYQVIGTDGMGYGQVSEVFLKMSNQMAGSVIGNQVKASKLQYWFDSNTDEMQTADGLSGNYVLNVEGLNDGLHTIHYQVIGTDNNSYDQVSAIFLKMSNQMAGSVIGNQVKASKLQYWFDSNTDDMQTADGLSGNYILNVASLNNGLHTIHYQVIGVDGNSYDQVSGVFLKMSNQIAESVIGNQVKASKLQYWFDNNTDDMQTADGLSGNYILNVEALADGLHTIHYQVIGVDGNSYDMASGVFLKMSNNIEESVIGSQVKASKLRYWFDSDTENQKSVDGSSGNYILDVHELSKGQHTINYQVIGNDGKGYGVSSAEFEKEVYSFKLTYMVDEEVYKTDSMAYSAKIEAEPYPEKEGYTFSGWSEIPDSMPASDVVVTGVFTINSHFVYYYVEGNVWHRDSLTYGALIAPPSQTPVKDGYTFTGWSGLVETLPDSDVTAVAQFSKNPLTVLFTKDVSVMLTPGQVNTITIDRDTVTAFAANMGYDISHLRLQFYADEENTTLAPVGSGNWISGTGVLSTQNEAPLFVSITIDENTVKLTNTNNKSLVKVGDKYDIPVFITDTTGTRAYQVNIGVTIIAERYAVNYFVDDEFYQADSLAYNVPVTLIANPIREGYTFSGWSEPPTTMPAADVTVTGSFAINSYKLTYIVDGEVYKADSVAFATELQSEPQPEKEGYTFSGWSEFPATMPSHDVTVTGTFTVNSYILRYYIDGEAYDSISVTYGEAIVPIAEPTREGKTFSGWIGVPETMPAHDVNVAGTFATDMYLVTFIIDGDVLKSDSVTFGLPIEAPTPEREGYTFSGWSEIPSTMPAHDVTITGSFAINSYKLTYIVDGEEYKADSVTYATTLTPLSEPTKEGYTFSGWSEIPVTMPAHDVSIIGTFKVNPTHETEDAVLAYDEEKGGYEFTGIKEPENKETTVPREVNGIPVVSVPEGTFAGNTQMQVLTWDSEASVDAKCFDEPEEHGNLLVFVSSDANVSYEGNVIRCIQMPDSTTRYEAEKITLYDGRPMTNPVPFTAKNISITKDFSKETIIGSTSGWETIVVPFDVDSITTEDGQLIAPFGSEALTDKHFWLAKMDVDAGFIKVSNIRANVPYIISMPNSEQYIEEYRITGKVTFHGRNIVVQPTADAISNAGPLFGLVPTYQEVAAADSVFVLNDEPYEADGITWPAGSVFVRSSRAARPFEAYTYAHASNPGNVKGYIPIDEMATGIKGINQWSMVNGQLLMALAPYMT